MAASSARRPRSPTRFPAHRDRPARPRRLGAATASGRPSSGSPPTSPSWPRRSTSRARSASAGRWARPSSGTSSPARPPARFAGAVVVDMTARVLNDAEWDLGLSPEACEARSLAIRDDFESFALGAGQAIFAQPVARRAPRARRLGERRIRPQRSPPRSAAVWASLVRQDVRALLDRIAPPDPDRPRRAEPALRRRHRRPSRRGPARRPRRPLRPLRPRAAPRGARIVQPPP